MWCIFLLLYSYDKYYCSIPEEDIINSKRKMKEIYCKLERNLTVETKWKYQICCRTDIFIRRVERNYLRFCEYVRRCDAKISFQSCLINIYFLYKNINSEVYLDSSEMISYQFKPIARYTSSVWIARYSQASILDLLLCMWMIFANIWVSQFSRMQLKHNALSREPILLIYHEWLCELGKTWKCGALKFTILYLVTSRPR